MTEKQIISNFFAEYCTKAKYLLHNLFFYRWESDILLFLDSGYIAEYEVKNSYEDLLNDKAKGYDVPVNSESKLRVQYEHYPKYQALQDNKGPNRFYYVIPEEILEKCISVIPEWAGVVSFKSNSRGYLYFSKKREAKLLHKKKYTEQEVIKGLTSAYYKTYNVILRLRHQKNN